MLRLIATILLLLSFDNNSVWGSQPTRQSKTPPGNSSAQKVIPSVAFCALLKSSKRYAGKLVRTQARWQFGFENTSLSDKHCPQQPTWLEFVDDQTACPESAKNRNTPEPSDKEAEVTVVGRLYGPGRFGHLGDYPYKFVVVCMEKIKVTGSSIK
jgi:hypothetical protein